MDGRTAVSLVSSVITFGLFLYSVYCVRKNYLAERDDIGDGEDLPNEQPPSIQIPRGHLAARLVFGLGALLAVLALTATAASWPPLGKPFRAVLASPPRDPARGRSAVTVARPAPKPAPEVATVVTRDPLAGVPTSQSGGLGPTTAQRRADEVRRAPATRASDLSARTVRPLDRMPDHRQVRPNEAAPIRLAVGVESSAVRRPERIRRPERERKEPPVPYRADRSTAGERPERSEPPGRIERPDRSERSQRGEQEGRADRPERAERPERVERPDRLDRAERVERLERLDRRERPERADARERMERSGRSGRRG